MTALPVADRATVRRTARALIARDRRAFVVVLVLHGVAAVTGLAAPWLLGRIVDEVAAGSRAATVDRLALAIGACVLAQGLLTRYAYYAGHRLGERALARLREEFVSRTLDLPVSVVERAGTGDLTTRSSVDVTTVGTMVRDVVPVFVIASAHLSLLFGAVFLLDPLLGLVALTGLPSIYAVCRWYLRRAGPAYLAEGAATADLTDALTTTAEGARTVEALRLTGNRIEHGTERIGRVWATRRRTLALRSVFFPVVEASYALPIAAILAVGGFFLTRDMVTLGEVVAAALYLQQAVDPLDRLLQFVEQAQRGIASLARVLGVGRVPPEPRGRESIPRGQQILVRGARFSYVDGRDVLHGIDLEVRPGERLAVVGPSGAGKSTLARLLAGMDAPGDGVVSIGGCPVTDLDPAERRRRIALVTQEHHVFIGSLRDNLAFAAPDASDRPDALRAGRRRRRLVRGSARRARHGARRRCPRARGRRRPAARPGENRARRSPHPDPRRGDRRARSDDRPADRAGARGRAHRAYGHRHRPPTQHRVRRRSGRGDGGRSDHRTRQPRRPHSRRWRVRGALAVLARLMSRLVPRGIANDGQLRSTKRQLSASVVR